MKRLLILIATGLFLFAVPLGAVKKSDKLKPRWITHTIPSSPSQSYFFVSSHGEGKSLPEAKQQAFVAMSQKIEEERGLTVNTSVRISESLSQTQSQSASEYRQEIVLDVVENGHKLVIVCKEVDDYWEENLGIYSVDVLYAVANKESYAGGFGDVIQVTTKYGAKGFLSIIPGVGQIYKGSVGKGSLIIGGEILAAGGIVLCENTRASYMKKMQEQPKHAAEYNSLADTWETGRNLCVGAAAAIYVYNLIDAFASTGAKQVVIKQKQASLTAVPYVDNHSIGVGLSFNF